MLNNIYSAAVVTAIATDNPYVAKLNTILTDVKGWILAAIAAVTIAVVVFHGFNYQQGNRSEKAEAIGNIKRTLYMGGGIFVLAWFASYVITQMQ